MATYAIGDVQGCFDALQKLLTFIEYNPNHDHLWFAGDLINRGPHSLETLRFIYHLQPRPIIVLGNHDLHYLAVASRTESLKPSDTLNELLTAPDSHILWEWLRHQKLLHYDQTLNMALVHAGLPPPWNLSESIAYAQEVEKALQGENYSEFFKNMYGNTPDEWDPHLQSWPRLRLITNYLTRMRLCDKRGRLELATKNATVSEKSPNFLPWFAHPHRKTAHIDILFGHWAALRGQVTVPHVYALDTGCVWGGQLSALRLEDRKWFRV